MTYLNSRQARILKFLLNTTDPLSIRKISLQLDLPARVIRYNLPYIEEWLTEEEIDFTLVHHNGLLLRLSDRVRKELLQRINEEVPIVDIFSPDDRISLILFELLRTPDYCSGVELQSRLSVARSTITRDLNNVEKWLAQKDISLSREPRKGIKAEGSIEDIRHALISLLFELDLESELLNFCIWGKATSGSNLNKLPEGSLQIIMQIFPWKIQDAWREVNRILQGIHVTLSESIILYLSLYWAIMKSHIQLGYTIQPDQHKLGLVKGTLEFEAVAASADKLYKMTGLTLPEQEIVQFTMELLGSIRGGKISSDQPGLFMQDQIAQEITDQLLKRVGDKVNEDLSNPQVRQKLQDHISRQVLRIKLNLPIRNKLSEQIQFMYPHIWQATFESIQEINEEVGSKNGIRIPKEEANYLTMYMVLAKELNDDSDKGKKVIVVCPSGGITVWMVVSRLKNEFPEITIVDVVPIKKLSQVDRTKLDAIITTINIIDRELPVIKVSPLLTKDDINLINEVLFGKRRN